MSSTEKAEAEDKEVDFPSSKLKWLRWLHSSFVV